MGDFVPNFERRQEMMALGPRPIPTAGAIPVKNEKGQITMKKVKVQRYMAGKAPEYAREHDDSADEDDYKPDVKEIFTASRKTREREKRDRETERIRPETVSSAKREHVSESSESEDERTVEERRNRVLSRRQQMQQFEKEEAPFEQEEPDDEDERQKRRELLKLQRRRIEEEEILAKPYDAEDISGESEEEEETEDETESEEEETVPRLKPVFVRKNDRVTLIEVEKEQEKLEKLRMEEERRKEERKRQSSRMVEDTLRREEEIEKTKKEEGATFNLNEVLTDDENEELAYELWKVREMKRLKRNRDEREHTAREKEEIERIHAMTEEERRNYLRLNPKIVTNRQEKGKYKFLQKYFHRGVFFLDKEDDTLRRNFAEATGEDEFDKSVLPKVMQVKNFGKASRSKWTHLTAEDTTDHQGIWATPTPLSVKFMSKHAGGFKNNFEKPSIKKRKTTE